MDGLGWPQMWPGSFFRPIQTLPTFWATWILILINYVLGGIPKSGFPDFEKSGFSGFQKYGFSGFPKSGFPDVQKIHVAGGQAEGRTDRQTDGRTDGWAGGQKFGHSFFVDQFLILWAIWGSGGVQK